MTYKVVLKNAKDEAHSELRITADDVDVDCCDSHPFHWFNFFNKDDKTVAAIPFEEVLYVVS